MNAKLLVGVSALALTLGACGANQPKSLVDTPEIRYKTAKVESAVEQIPKWYKKMPEEKGAIFTVGTSTTPDLQLAVDVAILNAKVVLADRINGKLKAMTKSWIAKFGQSDVDSSVMTELEKVAKNVVANVDVAGYKVAEQKIVSSGTQYRSFVLLEYSDVEAQKILLNRLRKDRLLLNKISATNAYKELDDAVNAAQEKEVAENNVIMEVLSE